VKHVELLVINKEYILLEEAFATLSAPLHIVVELKYVVMNKKLITLLDRATIAHRYFYHFSLSIRKAVVFFRSRYNKVNTTNLLGIIVSLS
jgi:hypothetical protein